MELEKLKQFKEFINCYDIVGKAYNLCENNDCGTRKKNNIIVKAIQLIAI